MIPEDLQTTSEANHRYVANQCPSKFQDQAYKPLELQMHKNRRTSTPTSSVGMAFTLRTASTNRSVSKSLSLNDRLIGLKDYWTDDVNRPYHFPHALALVMAHVAILETHDTPTIQRITGFPLLFVSRAIFELSRSPAWQANSGYSDLVQLAEQKDLGEFHYALGELLTKKDLFGPAVYSELESEWDRAMGVRVEL